MTLAFDVPPCSPSLVQRLDPRWKLAATMLTTFGVALVRRWEPALAALVLAVAAACLARLPARWFLRRLGAGLLFFAVFLVWLPLVHEPHDVPLDLGIVTLSLTGLLRLVALGAKLGAMLTLMLVLLATAPLQDTFRAAHALRIPGVLLQLVMLTYRYAYLLVEEFGRLRNALRVRGFRNRPDLHSYRTIGQVAGTLLVRSHERSERVAQAMSARGFDGQYRSLHDFQTRWTDVAAFVVMLCVTAGILIWDWLVRSAS